MSSIRFVGVAFDPILAEIDLHLVAGWTGIVGANGAGKTTLLRLVTGDLAPSEGRVIVDGVAHLCAQRIGDVALDPDDPWAHRLGCVTPARSEGERKRWQLAAALAAEPDVLLLDEPTNHVDAETRAIVIAALRRFKGTGVIVSHDRELLDALTRNTIRVDAGRARAYSGAYSHAREQWLAEERATREAWATANAARKKAARALAEAHRTAESAEKSRSTSSRIKGPRDSDAREAGRKGRAEMGATAASRTVARRRAELERVPEVAMVKGKGGDVWFDFAPSPKKWLTEVNGLAIARDTRLHVKGDNGSGKSTLLRAIARAAPDAFYLPQEVTAVRKTDDPRVGQLLAALGHDPSRSIASPGELQKLALALGLARRAHLLILDEPTNHLDLPAIERLEDALAGYPGAIVLASHDAAFAARVTHQSLNMPSRYSTISPAIADAATVSGDAR